ncbi:hypothetical protein VOLCADRAFT_99263 [Volvox carteri f. nagariensis]|uniref:C2H2-type domain-containing protein n=1 Tax=Volvox carteri f. nagariensis TaxID=3068 RepID=D8UHC9_VOLCA|nr:uncharacterized protein VOLCADRAFT_99263 [Volvox carteri f. nagariensis]EFJ40883.1 hypothetical protein VOLCADRAFT_99263 [Volvox carteri f. nagariensis]|eukprot:XP_002958043.1 hypothetical protein VOLCADRAFT_99263 [Volvox carteri f. nagariensis]
MGQHKNDTAFVKTLGDITFGDLYNKHVKFETTTGKGPYKCTLALQVDCADCFVDCTDCMDGFDPTEYLFNHVLQHDGKEELVKMWLSWLDTGSIMEMGAELSQRSRWMWRRRSSSSRASAVGRECERERDLEPYLEPAASEEGGPVIMVTAEFAQVQDVWSPPGAEVLVLCQKELWT